MHSSTIYPVKAPNGSTIILYASENGVGILWRGGRPLKQPVPAPKAPAKPPPKVNGTKDAIVILDSDDDDDEPAKPAAVSPPTADFEDEEEELDPDRPYPSIVQHMRLPLNTNVLHIAVPHVPTASELRPGQVIPPIFNEKIVFAVACTDFTVRIVTLPLGPPPNVVKASLSKSKTLYGEEVVKIPSYIGHQTIPAGVSMTWTSKAEPRGMVPSEDVMEVDGEEDGAAVSGRRSPRKKRAPSTSEAAKDANGFDLLVASHSADVGGLLKIWRFGLSKTSVETPDLVSAYQTVTLPNPASKITFNTAQYPKSRHSQLLIADAAGVARIYDPFAPRGRNSSNNATGAFVALFRTRFESAKSSVESSPILASRKSLLDVAWVSQGYSILALLSDGEWGIWDVRPSSSTQLSDPSLFSLRNSVGTSELEKASSGPSSPKSRSSRNLLVPMTPNTRRKKEETLFQGSSSSTIPTRGGLAVASLLRSSSEVAEESVVIWYGKEIYRLVDLAKFRARTASSSSGGSLPGPGLSQVHDVPLLGEDITSVSLFNTTTREASMAVPRDLLLSAENRLIISTTTNKPAGRASMTFHSREDVEEEASKRSDQALLAHGELGIDGMQRLMDGMSGGGSHNALTLGNPRKVLFAPS